MLNFFNTYGADLFIKTIEHLQISLVAIVLGCLLGIPLGALLSQFPRLSTVVIKIIGIIQTVPSLALLSLMVPLFGIGKTSSTIALFLYSLLPILNNAYAGLSNVDPTYLDAAKGIGMSNLQILLNIKLPLAANVIIAGIRISSVYVISWATLAAYIGAGGLGDFIFNGLSLYRTELILSGTIVVAILALTIDHIFKKIEEQVSIRISGVINER